MNEYLVLRINQSEPHRNQSDKINCPHGKLLRKLNELTESEGEYAYKSIQDIIDSYQDYGAMVIVDLTTLDFITR